MPLIALRIEASDVDESVVSMLEDAVKAAGDEMKGMQARRRAAKAAKDKADAKKAKEQRDAEEIAYEQQTYKPIVPDFDIDFEILEETVGMLDELVRDGIDREDILNVLLGIRRSVVELWNALAECYAELIASGGGDDGDSSSDDESSSEEEDEPKRPMEARARARTSTPRALQRVLALLAAMLAALSLAGPQMITPVVDALGGGEAVAMLEPPGNSALLTLPPPPDKPQLVRKDGKVVRKRGDTRPLLRVRREGGSAGDVEVAPLAPPSPILAPPSAPPEVELHPSDVYTEVDPKWWMWYIQNAMLASLAAAGAAAVRK